MKFPRRKRKTRQPLPGGPRRSVIVRFYRACIGDTTVTENELDRTAAFHSINDLAWDRSTAEGRYYHSVDGDTFSAWPYLVQDRLRLTLGRDLVDANPAYEQKGRLDFVEIDAESKWIGLTYCVLFKDGIAGVIFSQQGPATHHLAAYLQHKGKAASGFEFKQLSRKNIAAELQRLQWVSQYEIAVVPGSLFFPKREGAEESDMDRVLEAAATYRDAKIVRITVESQNKKSPLMGFLDFVKSLVASGGDTAWAQEFKVKGPDFATGTLRPINLLRDYLCATKLVRLHGKALEEDAAFRAIESAYAENIPEFAAMAAFTVQPVAEGS